MQRTFSMFAILGAAFAAIVGITALLTGQPTSKLSRQPASSHRIGVVDDWSHHHLVFSNPGTYEQAAKTGASYAKWLTIRYDNRFILQQMKRRAEAAGGAKSKPKPAPKPKGARLKRDWSQPILTGTVQPNAYPAKWGASLTSASCRDDFVVYPTGTPGSESAASIVAYNNLYSGCGGTVPSIYWAYYAPNATISTSPIISDDGSQMAVIESDGTRAALLLVRLAASTGTVESPIEPIYESNADYRGYTLIPCMTALHFTTYNPPGNQIYMDDTFSAPFYDYASDDALYVGDDSGYLHKFTGIFYGTPAEAGGPWPVQLTTTNKLTSPVYDPVSGNVFVGDTGGYLYAVGSGNAGTTSGTLYGKSGKLGDAIIDAPLVDSNAGMVYVFVTTDSGGKNAVFQFSTSGSVSGLGNSNVEVGTGGTGYYLYSGDFDNAYYSSATPAGNLWVVGNTGATTGPGKLYRIPISSSGMGTPVVAVGTLTGSEHPWPSPLIEFCNNGTSACDTDGTNTIAGTDYLFFSVNRGAVGSCNNASGNGCVLSYDITHPSAPTFSAGLNVTNVASPGCWATGGLVIDNSDPSTTLGASQVYFVNLNGNSAGAGNVGGLTSDGCASSSGNPIQAVQASQKGLN